MAKAARKTARKNAGSAAKPSPKQRAAVKKSLGEIQRAHKALDLKVRRHHQVVSAMFFIP